MDTTSSVDMDPNHIRHEPVQLIDFVKGQDGNTFIKLKHQELDNVLRPVGDLPLCIVCICGPSRQGKSFALGYMIRCLEALEKEETDWMGWDDKHKPLKGFTFRNGMKPETQGIWVWSHAFKIKNYDEKEIAVLLVDTQGTNDQFTTSKDMSAIVGLSLLSSSVMIFNFFNNLLEDTLLALDTYIQYGLLALENAPDNKAPFQKLSFLIRDWNNPGEFPFGKKGGKDFIDKKLGVSDDLSEEAKEKRERIRKCFEELKCFLMPKIDSKALYKDFTGSIAEIGENFAKKLQEYINELLCSGNITTKKVLGNEITARQLPEFLEMYVNIFNSSEMPEAKSFYEGTAYLVNDGVVEKAMKKYISAMKNNLRKKIYLSEKELSKFHETSEKEAMIIFTAARKLGGKEKCLEFETKLEQKIREEFRQLKSQNEAKRSRYLDSTISDGEDEFRQRLQDNFSFDEGDNQQFYEEGAINKVIIQEKCIVVDELIEKLSSEPVPEREALVQRLEKVMEDIAVSFINKNMFHRSNAEKALNSLVDELLSNYKSNMDEYLDNNKLVEVENLNDFHAQTKSSKISEFLQVKKPGKLAFQKEFLAKLETAVDQAYSYFEKGHKLHLHDKQQEADEYIKEKIIQYVKTLTDVAKNAASDEDISLVHSESVGQLLDIFCQVTNTFPVGSALHMELNRNFKEALDKVCTDVIAGKKLSHESYRRALDSCFEFYRDSMKNILQDGFMNESALEQEHGRVFETTLEKYEACEKLGNQNTELSLDIKTELKNKIQQYFQSTIKQDNKNREEAVYNKALNCVTHCKREYEKIIKKHMDIAKTAEDLEDAHLEAKTYVVIMFQEMCPNSDPDFLLAHQENLRQEIDETFEELKDLFDLQHRKADVELKGIKLEVQKVYNEEMQKLCKNSQFIIPSTMEEMHVSCSNLAIGKYKELTKHTLSPAQCRDLEAELRAIFEKYKTENDMKLNFDLNTVPAIGIDLGTTYSCVAVFYAGQVIIIPNHDQGNLTTTPSYVSFKEDGSEENYGHPAKTFAYMNPELTIYDVKRIIGRKMDDPCLQSDLKFWPFTVVEDEGVPKIDIHGKLFHPEQISAKLLKHLTRMAEKHLKMKKGTIKKAVITVPAYFTDGQRQATKDAGNIAGLDVLHILNEPTSAAMAYSLQRLDASVRKVLIFDLGGGTFDVAVVDAKFKNIDILGVNGDTHLGGEDFDESMMKYCAEQFKAQHGIDLLARSDSSKKQVRDEAKRNLRRLKTRCEDAKKFLTSGTTVTVEIDGFMEGQSLNVEVSRSTFEELNMHHFQKTIDIVDRVLKATKVRKEDIEDIVFVGGSTRIPKVQEMLTTYFNGKTLNYSINPDEAVAYGAAVQAAILNGGEAKETLNFSLIQDVYPHSLGIETVKSPDMVTKYFSKIIPQNTKIPENKTKVFYTATDDQTSVLIKIFQGEDALTKNNEVLGNFSLSGIPPNKAGEEALDVTMEIDVMGILNVSAVSKSTGSRNSIVVKTDKQRMSLEKVISLREV